MDDFLNIESEAPNCPCARPLNQVKSVPTFVSTQTTAVCDPTKQGTCSIIQDAFLNSNDAALSAALNATTGPDAEERQSLAVWTEDVLGSADGYCFTISNAIERIESTLGATAIGGGSLLPRSDFEDSMLAAIRSAFLSIANEYTNAGTVRVAAEAALHHNDPFRNAPHRHRPQTLRKNAAAGRIQQFAGSRDMAGLEAAKDRSPRGCRCSGSDAKPFCRFNLEIGGIEHEGGCSVSALVRGINAKALDTTLYTKSFGIFPPNVRACPSAWHHALPACAGLTATQHALQTPKASSSDYTVFDGPFHEYIDVCDEAFFSLYDKEDLALPEVAFSEYFDQCAPTECSYVEIRRPSVTELIALMLGLLGGLTTVIRVGVGVVGKKLFRGKTSVESSTKPHGTRDGMSGVEMSRPENA